MGGVLEQPNKDLAAEHLGSQLVMEKHQFAAHDYPIANQEEDEFNE